VRIFGRRADERQNESESEEKGQRVFTEGSCVLI
jgi:hypothetical protein